MRLILDGPLDGATNMAVDRVLFEALEAGQTRQPVLRLYRWRRPTLSLGFHQRSEEAHDAGVARRLGVDVVRRPTGGRTLVHAEELTYGFLAPTQGRFESLPATAACLASALRRAFRRLGIEADEAPAPRDRRQLTPRGRAACLASTGRYELTWRGRKLAASAQRRGRRAFLQHGSLPLSVPRALTRQLTGFEVGERAVGVNEILALPASPEAFSRAVVAGFEEELGVAGRPWRLEAGLSHRLAVLAGEARVEPAGGPPEVAISRPDRLLA